MVQAMDYLHQFVTPNVHSSLSVHSTGMLELLSEHVLRALASAWSAIPFPRSVIKLLTFGIVTNGVGVGDMLEIASNRVL